MSELRNRAEDAQRASSSTLHLGADASAMSPDFAIVVPKNAARVNKTIEALVGNGFYATAKAGSKPDTVLVVARARPELVQVLGGQTVTPSKRAVVVQQAVAKSGIEPSEGFIVGDDGNFNASFANTYLKRPLGKISIAHVQTQYGDQLATYFSFAQFSQHSLLGPAIAGLSIYYTKGPYAAGLVPVLLFWALTHVYGWRRKEALLAAQYPSLGDKPAFGEGVKTPRPSYKGLSPGRRQFRRVLFWPLLLTLLVVYAAGLLAILGLEVFATQIYDGPYQSIVRLTPIGANVVASQIYALVYGTIVKKWLNWEDYAVEEDYRSTRTQRRFYLTLLLNYTPLLLTAYVYLPFGNLIIGVLAQLRQNNVGDYFALVPEFTLDTGRLAKQAFFYSVTNQIIAFVTGLILPLAIGLFKQKRSSVKGRANKLQLLAPFDADTRVAELVSLFGYVMIVTPVWPLAPVAAMIGVWVHTRASLVLLGYVNRQPNVELGHTIGKWNSDLHFLAGVGAITAPTLIHMYGKTSSTYSLTQSFVDASPISTLAIAFVAENIFLGLSTIASAVVGELPLGIKKREEPVSAQETKESYAPRPEDLTWNKLDVSADIQLALK